MPRGRFNYRIVSLYPKPKEARSRNGSFEACNGQDEGKICKTGTERNG